MEKDTQSIKHIHGPLGASESRTMIVVPKSSDDRTLTNEQIKEDGAKLFAFLNSSIPNGTYDELVANMFGRTVAKRLLSMDVLNLRRLRIRQDATEEDIRKATQRIADTSAIVQGFVANYKAKSGQEPYRSETEHHCRELLKATLELWSICVPEE